MGVMAARGARFPVPPKTFHDFDRLLVQHVMVLRGDAVGLALPVAELLPPGWRGEDARDLWDSLLTNGEWLFTSYKTAVPAWFLAAGALPAAVGLSPWTLRLGPLVVFALFIALMYSTASRIAGPRAGLLSGALACFTPVLWQSAASGMPTLGLMTAVIAVVCCLVHADGFRSWGWSVLTALVLAVGLRMGESVGDAIATATPLVGVIAAAVLGGLIGCVTERRPWRLVGLAAAAWVAWRLVDVAWLQWHVHNYMLPESGLGRTQPVPDAELWAGLLARGGLYPAALWQSLLMPVGTTALVLALLPFAWAGRRRWITWGLLAGVTGGWAVLTVSSKAHDYYAAPIVPLLVLITGLGLATLRGRATWLAALPLGWMGLIWLFFQSNDKPAVADLSCTGLVQRAVAFDPTFCSKKERHPGMRQWFRDWRSPPGQNIQSRERMTLWLTQGRGAQILDAFPAGGLVWVATDGRTECDAAHVTIQAARPDMIVQWASMNPPQRHEKRLVREHDDILAVTCADVKGRGATGPSSLPLWLNRGAVRLGQTIDIALWKVTPSD